MSLWRKRADFTSLKSCNLSLTQRYAPVLFRRCTEPLFKKRNEMGIVGKPAFFRSCLNAFSAFKQLFCVCKAAVFYIFRGGNIKLISESPVKRAAAYKKFFAKHINRAVAAEIIVRIFQNFTQARGYTDRRLGSVPVFSIISSTPATAAGFSADIGFPS